MTYFSGVITIDIWPYFFANEMWKCWTFLQLLLLRINRRLFCRKIFQSLKIFTKLLAYWWLSPRKNLMFTSKTKWKYTERGAEKQYAHFTGAVSVQPVLSIVWNLLAFPLNIYSIQQCKNQDTDGFESDSIKLQSFLHNQGFLTGFISSKCFWLCVHFVGQGTY